MLSCFTAALSAATVQVNYTATLATVGGTPFGLSGNDRGRVLSGYFLYDTATQNTNSNPNTGDYLQNLSKAGFSGTLSGAGTALTVTGSTMPSIEVVNTSAGGGDSFRFTDGPGSGTLQARLMSANGLPNQNVKLNFYIQSSFQSVISTDALPTNFPWQGNDSINFPNTFDLTDGHGDLLFQLTTVSTGGAFGHVDTPANGASGLSGAIGVTGWAVSPAGISNVGLYREPVAGETAPAGGLIFLGNAAQVPGARPDIAMAYPGYPQNNYGWGAQILSNELPGTNGGPLGVGSYKLHALATAGGASTDLSGAISITVNNANTTTPFGTIDTPAPGATVSGTGYNNFGWVVTPNSSNVIPKDGSTIEVYIDSMPVGHPVYNQYRVDIATLFPGLQNSGGAVGYFVFDTTKYANGLHTIAWSVSDNGGHTQGIGSRFFLIQN